MKLIRWCELINGSIAYLSQLIKSKHEIKSMQLNHAVTASQINQLKQSVKTTFKEIDIQR
jgi:hypothetical protein